MIVTLVSIIIYFAALLTIGIASWKRSRSYSQYNLAGRSNNKWVTGISHQAASASGWLLMGLPGAAYIMGFGVVWTLVGWICGSLLNWFVISRRLRAASEHYGAETILDLFARRVGDHKGIVIRTAAIVLVLIMVVNSSAELLAIGKVITIGFGISPTASIIIGLLIVMTYTSVGGFLAMSWSNLIQGLMMVMALVVVPIGAAAAFFAKFSSGEGIAAMPVDYFAALPDAGGFWSAVAFITGGMGIALMFPGYIHALSSLMAIKNPKELTRAGIIANVWAVLSLLGATTIGLMGRYLLPDLDDPETALLALAASEMPTALFGAMAAAILAASLSSVCAYIIAASSALGASLLVRDSTPQRRTKVVRVQRVVVVFIALAACVLAFNGGLVFEIALFAAACLGAAFGPLVLASIFSSSINLSGAVASMSAGPLVVVVWYYSGASSAIMHEVFPGVIVSAIVLFAVSRLTGGPSAESRAAYDAFSEQYRIQGRDGSSQSGVRR